MSSPVRNEARARLLDLLGKSVRQSLKLREFLESEHDALKSQDVGGLPELLAEKRQCVDTLKSLDQQRIARCQEAGFPAGPAQMDAMCDWCDDASALRNAWNELLAVADGCKRLNDTIGAIIHARRNQAAKGLAVLVGGASTGTYGRNAADGGTGRSRNLAEA